MAKVMVFGTFDGFHKGHESFLSQAKDHGSSLIVVVARDRNVFRAKGKQPLHGEEKRAAGVRGSGLADVVILGDEMDYFMPIKMHMPDVICLGYDQHDFSLEDELKKRGLYRIRITRLRPHMPEKYKSSILNNKKCHD